MLRRNEIPIRFLREYLLYEDSSPYVLQKQSLMWIRCSTSCVTSTLRYHRTAGNGHVYCGGPTNIWHHHQLHYVLPRGAGVLRDVYWASKEVMGSVDVQYHTMAGARR